MTVPSLVRHGTAGKLLRRQGGRLSTVKSRDGRCTDEIEQNEEHPGGKHRGMMFYKGLGIAVSSLMRVQHRKKQFGLQAWAKARFPLSYCTYSHADSRHSQPVGSKTEVITARRQNSPMSRHRRRVLDSHRRAGLPSISSAPWFSLAHGCA